MTQKTIDRSNSVNTVSNFRSKFTEKIKTVISHITDQPLEVSSNQRLYNFLCFFNSAINLLGVIPLIFVDGNFSLSIFNLLSSLFFFVLWYLSRYKVIDSKYLYWPFALLILVFLGFSHIANSGSLGGSQFYFILGTMLCVIVAQNMFQRISTIVLFAGTIIALFLFEYYFSEYSIKYPGTDYDSMIDRMTNYAVVTIFVGYIVHKLSETLKEEKDFSDQLLKDIMPEKIAEQLKRNGMVVPERYESATVIFIDMVGFSKCTLNMAPSDVLSLLAYYYNFFDKVFLKHRLEKIKTLGDGYMAVGGIPKRNETHPYDAINGCLEILRFVNSPEEIEKRSKMNIANLGVRIGINTGPLIAGVIGLNKFIYDVWGTTVNLASRMESSGIEGHINVSQSTYEITQDRFEYDSCRTLEVKNMGEVNTYTVKGLKK